MDVEESILRGVRTSVVGVADNKEFDDELIPYINNALGQLNQNGVGTYTIVTDETTKWGDLMDVSQIKGNVYFKMVPLFVALSTKLLFDPPPPSNVEYHSKAIDESLWRLKIAYEEDELEVTK